MLLEAVRGVRPDLAPDDIELLRAAAGAWSIVHGFATLWLDGNLDPVLTEGSPEEATAAMLQAWGAMLLTTAGGRPGGHGSRG